MSQETQQEVPNSEKPLGHPRSGVKLYADDDKEIVKIVKEIKQCGIKMDILLFMRETINRGLPLMEEKWRPIIERLKK